jgi:hypothetical protein
MVAARCQPKLVAITHGEQAATYLAHLLDLRRFSRTTFPFVDGHHSETLALAFSGAECAHQIAEDHRQMRQTGRHMSGGGWATPQRKRHASAASYLRDSPIIVRLFVHTVYV